MTKWLIIIGTPGGAGGGELGGETRIYSLIVEFGADDIVSNLALVTDRRPCTDDKTLCYAEGRLDVLNESDSANQTYDDESLHATLTDTQLQEFRGEETVRFSATLDSGASVELIELDGMVFDTQSMSPFSGRISYSDDDLVSDDDGMIWLELSYEAGKLDGPVILRDAQGSVLMEIPVNGSGDNDYYFVWDYLDIEGK